ncbi:hypothetical protein GCM10011369_27360 [Neiella marina]|uniref:Glycosyltransferase 2-like domain-containing protein n=1 Tax=Neiella marina TaxID=508461 RepID=A0A8J2U7I2_9GAMM|nr:glycosyltransferase family 2 protein [Neiella marina]GGA83871.1 hypothetical protein GCM10011369_27360 [Neiella marina]
MTAPALRKEQAKQVKQINPPAVSIIVPIYNAEQWLSECLDSLLNQTLDSLEIVLVLDAPTDNSLAICQNYIAKNPGLFTLVSLATNQGVSVARNHGLDAASGQYIGFVDADDWAHPQMFASLLATLSEQTAQQKAVWARCDMCSFDDDRSDSKLMDLQAQFADTFLTNKLFAADVIKQHGLRFYPDVIFEDEAFIYLLRMLEGPAARCDGQYYWYRLNPNGQCRDESKHRFNLMDKQAMLSRLLAEVDSRQLLPAHRDLLLECLTNHALSALYYPIGHAERVAFFRFIQFLIKRYQLLPANRLLQHHQHNYVISRFFRFIRQPLCLAPLAWWCQLRLRLNQLANQS